ncbi:MAG: HD-GYP domain-containing protein [Limnobacter sp.]|nr:HD-GYP domain-containing protein [Limnobacter sp.]
MSHPAQAPELSLQRRCQIGVSRLEPGMYVADLDRPWLDTPFLLEGFLVDSSIELETLRRYCRYVYVDPDRSDPSLGQKIRNAELVGHPLSAGLEHAGADEPDTETLLLQAAGVQAPRRTDRSLRARDDIRISTQTRERFRRFVRATAVATDTPRDGMIERTAGWLRAWLSADENGETPRAWQQRSLMNVRAMLPPHVKYVRHPDPIPFDDALPGARAAIVATLCALDDLLTALRANAAPDLAPTTAAVAALADAMIANPDSPIWLARNDDASSRPLRHALAVSLYLLALGRSLGLRRSKLISLGLIGLLADVGKARLPRALLEKPGMLTPSEHTIIKEHVRLGLEALRRGGPLPEEVAQGIGQHHERLDGSGYPKGLRGDEIGPWGRMAAIADSFAALISPRPYARASAPQDAMMSLYEWTGSSFDEALVEQFVQAIGIFPVGSLIELSSGEIAVVMAHNQRRRLEPRVMVLSDARHQRLARPFESELPMLRRGSAASSLRIARGLPAGAFEIPRTDAVAGAETARR